MAVKGGKVQLALVEVTFQVDNLASVPELADRIS